MWIPLDHASTFILLLYMAVNFGRNLFWRILLLLLHLAGFMLAVGKALFHKLLMILRMHANNLVVGKIYYWQIILLSKPTIHRNKFNSPPTFPAIWYAYYHSFMILTLHLFWYTYTERMKDKHIQRDDEYSDSEDEGEDRKGLFEHYEESTPAKKKRAITAQRFSSSDTAWTPPIPFRPQLKNSLSHLHEASDDAAHHVAEMVPEAILSSKLSTLRAALALSTTTPEPPAKRNKLWALSPHKRISCLIHTQFWWCLWIKYDYLSLPLSKVIAISVYPIKRSYCLSVCFIYVVYICFILTLQGSVLASGSSNGYSDACCRCDYVRSLHRRLAWNCVSTYNARVFWYMSPLTMGSR